MKILDLRQGSEEWLNERPKYHCASDAPAMMGVSPYMSRAELVQLVATGDERKHSRFAEEVLFPNGHAIEEAARPLAERIIGAELYRVVGASDDDYLLVSFDGLTITGNDIWECKQWNEAKAALVRSDRVPHEDYWQAVQQLVVSGAQRCHYTVTDGTPERYVTTTVTLNDDDAKALLAGWEQLDRDVAAYVPRDDDPQPVGVAPERLPALAVEVVGNVVSSNLVEFERAALAVFADINRDLQTDEDFANAEQTVKWCKTVEDKLDLTKEQALAQTRTIDELFRAIDSIKETARATRLELDKLVKARKQAVRGEIVLLAKDAYKKHTAALAVSMGQFAGERAPLALEPVDFGAPLKGLKTVTTLRDAADTALAQAKLAANAQADRVRANVARLNELAAAHGAIFADWRGLITKEPADMESAVKLRIMQHEAAEREKRAEIERAKQAEAELVRREETDRIRAEEAAKLRAAELPRISALPQELRKPVETELHETFRRDLEAWREYEGVSAQAYAGLLNILDYWNAWECAA